MSEVRVTSATGGEKGRKPQQIGTIDPRALLALAEVGGFGAEKYSAYNYLKGYDWSLSYDAAQRHLMEFWAGNDVDDESGLLHVLHAGWHCLAMASFLLRELGTDDRFEAAPEPDIVEHTSSGFGVYATTHAASPDPVGCLVTVTGDSADVHHCFQVGTTVRVVEEDFGCREQYECEAVDDVDQRWWVAGVDLA